VTRLPDTITLEPATLPCRIGVLEGENEQPQPVRIRLKLEVDLERVLSSGRLQDTVDYGPLHELCVQTVCGRRWGLIEELGAELMRVALATDGVLAVAVRVSKLDPPLGDGAGPVTLEFRRERD